MRREAERILDEYLAASARAGDRGALERLAMRWEKKLVRHAFRLTGDIEAARDAAQDGWADIVRGLPGLVDAALFPSWAFRIVTRRSADAIRRNQRRRRTEAALAREPGAAERSAAAVEALTDAAAVRRTLAELPADQRAAIALFYLEDLSVAEIAVALAVPPGTIKTRLMHARRRLRAALETTTRPGESDVQS
jgi:RNA polymerase sigma-70 factor (ECF subfamily)